jgi:hypothetical protein
MAGTLARATDRPREKFPMASKGSISRRLRPLEAGDPEAVQEHCARYFKQLVEVAEPVSRSPRLS